MFFIVKSIGLRNFKILQTVNSIFKNSSIDTTHPSECRFRNDNGDIRMDFNFMQCGSDYSYSNTTDLVYRNVIQNQEYYEHIYLGVLVSHMFEEKIF